jgi:hypothetical protein
MAKARVGIRLDKPGIGQLLKSSEMAATVTSVAEDLASAAGSDYSVVTDTDRRKTRVIAMVVDYGSRALGREAATGNLARAVASKTEGWVKR